MTTITITLPRATVEQALEAMNEAVFSLYSPYTSETPEEKALYETIAAFRAALAQQAEPVLQGPVRIKPGSYTLGATWVGGGGGSGGVGAPPQQAEPVEPVAWVRLEAWKSGKEWPDDCFTALPAEGLTPLYTPPPQRKPLTSDKDRPDQGATYVEGYGYVDTRAVRAIERAHGIKENAND